MSDIDLKKEEAFEETPEYFNIDNNRYHDFKYEIKIHYRYLRKIISSFIRARLNKKFKTILYIADENYSGDYVKSLTRQYPDKNIKVLIPLFEKTKELEKYSHHFYYELQNEQNSAQIFKLPQNNYNIEEYGIFSNTFSNEEGKKNFKDIKYLSPFMKCVRIAGKLLKPDIIHCNDYPFFLGAEFEIGFYPIRVFEQINDFSNFESFEPFWAIMNILDKNGIRKLCKDKHIKRYLALLFKQRVEQKINITYKYLNKIYKNYIIFRSKININDEVEENLIFQKLNERIIKLFPQIFTENGNYNVWKYTLKRCDFWAVLSKTYYEELFNNPNLSPDLYDTIKNTKEKSTYVRWGLDETESRIKFPFTTESFREERNQNKEYLLKELSKERLKLKFTDDNLFQNEERNVRGYLESFHNEPLIFAQFSENADEEGLKLFITSILKLFELNRIFKVIINYTGVKNHEYLKKFIDFCKEKNVLDGNLIFLKGNLNLPQFLSSADIILLPNLKNPSDTLYLKALKYGCIPIVSNNGIYNDVIFNILDDMLSGCGFKTKEPINVTTTNNEEIFYETVKNGLNFYAQNHSIWNVLIKNAINTDTNWSFKIIEKYNQIYEELV